MAIDGHFSLEQLLASGIHVGGVGEGDAAAELLLHGDARGGVAERAQIIGIDFDRAGAEKLLHAAADGGVKGSPEQGVGGIGNGLLLLLRIEALLAGGVAQGQQRDDVGLRQRRVAAVTDGEFLRRTVQAEGDVVVFNVRRGAEVDDGLDAHRVGEGDVAALEVVASSGDQGAALGNGNAAQERGRSQRAVEAEIHVTGQFGEGILETQLRRRDNVHVEAHVIRRSIGRRNGSDRGIGLGGESRQVEIGTDGETRDQDVAAEEQVALLPLQVESGVGQ